MSAPRWIASAVLIAAGALFAGCGQGSGSGETSVTPPAVPISVSRTGGIAGVSQTIEIAPDGAWVYTDKKKNQRETGTLAASQRIQVLRYVADPAFAEQLGKAAKPDSACADGFSYTINTGGETTAFTDCGDSDDHPTVKAVIAAITEATPF